VAANRKLEDLDHYIAEQFGFLMRQQEFLADVKASGRDVIEAKRMLRSIENSLWDLIDRRKALLERQSRPR
jgi:hypothetical protein